MVEKNKKVVKKKVVKETWKEISLPDQLNRLSIAELSKLKDGLDSQLKSLNGMYEIQDSIKSFTNPAIFEKKKLSSIQFTLRRAAMRWDALIVKHPGIFPSYSDQIKNLANFEDEMLIDACIDLDESLESVREGVAKHVNSLDMKLEKVKEVLFYKKESQKSDPTQHKGYLSL